MEIVYQCDTCRAVTDEEEKRLAYLDNDNPIKVKARYQAYVKTEIAKAVGFKEDTTNKAELSLVDSYFEVQLAVANRLADELQESMNVHMKYEHGLISEEEFNAYQLSEEEGRRQWK